MARFMAMPMPMMKNLSRVREILISRGSEAYDKQTTGKGGVVTMIVYPRINRPSDIMRDLARPILEDSGLMNNAAAKKPRALQRKIIDTVP